MDAIDNLFARQAEAKRWRLMAALLLWMLLLWGVQYARRGYWEPDEARFVYVAREMAAAGEWLVPHRNGVPYPDKPPLMFWTINLGESLLPLPFGSRLPLMIGVLLSLGSVYGMGRLWRDHETGMRAVLVLSSSWLFWKTSGLGQIDALLLGLDMAAILLLFRYERVPRARTPWAAFVLLGLALLAKGPVGLLVPLGIFLTTRNLRGEAWRHLGAGRLCVGLAIAVAIPLAWVALCAWSGAPSDYLQNLLFTQNVSRAAGALGHRTPFYYLLFQAPVAFMPWIMFLPTACADLRRAEPALLRRLTTWTLFVLIFFSLSASKRTVYILPAMPALALAVAAGWEGIVRSQACRRMAAVLLVSGAAGFLLAAFTVVFNDHLPLLATNDDAAFYLEGLAAWPFLVAAGLLVAGLSGFTGSRRVDWTKHFALSLCLALAALGGLVYPEMNSMKEPEEMLPLAGTHIPSDGRLLLYGIHGETLALHAGRTGMRCDTDTAMAEAMQAQRRGLAVFLERDTADLHARFPSVNETGVFRMGGKRYVWAAFDNG